MHKSILKYCISSPLFRIELKVRVLASTGHDGCKAVRGAYSGQLTPDDRYRPDAADRGRARLACGLVNQAA